MRASDPPRQQLSMTTDATPTPIEETKPVDQAPDTTEAAKANSDASAEALIEQPEAPSPTSEPIAEAPQAEPEPEVAPSLEAEAPASTEPAAIEQPAEPIPAPEPAPEPVVAATAPVPKAETKVEDDSNLFDAYMSGSLDLGDGGQEQEGGFKKLSKGDRVEATIIQVDKDRVFVDLGTKAEGVVPLHELTDQNIESAKDHFSVGDKISVVVLKPEGGLDSPAVVSKRRAEFEEAWDRIEDAFREQTMITAQVVDRVKGGLVVDVGVRGFVPATHVGNGKLRNIEKYVGQPLQLKVIEIDRERKKVVLSNRQAEEERRSAAKENIFLTVKPGDILDGTVRRLTDYGAFIDLGGVDGLLHISEMSWMRINHPREMFKEGQKIQVMVLRLDPGAGKLSLGHRQVLPDPWNLIKQNYTVNQRLTVTIGRLVQGGAFVKLPEGAEAFVPVSEMSYRRVKRPQEVVEENQEVEVQIIDLRPDERRMVLSMRAVGGGAGAKEPQSYQPSSYEDEFRIGPKGGKPGAKKGAKKGGRGGRDDFADDLEEVAGRRGFATGGATIGERLGALRGFLGREDEEDEGEKTEEAPAETEPEAEAEAGTEE